MAFATTAKTSKDAKSTTSAPTTADNGTAKGTHPYMPAIGPLVTPIPTSLEDEDEVDDIISPKQDIQGIFGRHRPLLSSVMNHALKSETAAPIQTAATLTQQPPPPSGKATPSGTGNKASPVPQASQSNQKTQIQTPPQAAKPMAVPKNSAVNETDGVIQGASDHIAPNELRLLINVLSMVRDASFWIDGSHVEVFSDKDSPEFCCLKFPRKQFAWLPEGGFSMTRKNTGILVNTIRTYFGMHCTDFIAFGFKDSSLVIERCSQGTVAFEFPVKRFNLEEKRPAYPAVFSSLGNKNSGLSIIMVDTTALLTSLLHLSQFSAVIGTAANAVGVVELGLEKGKFIVKSGAQMLTVPAFIPNATHIVLKSLNVRRLTETLRRSFLIGATTFIIYLSNEVAVFDDQGGLVRFLMKPEKKRS